MDENIIVKFREEECLLKEAIEKCQPGESIEGVSCKDFNKILRKISEKRGREYSYSTDRRYGKWRFILFGRRD